MKLLYPLLLLIFIPLYTFGQGNFPSSHIGVWKGDLKIYNTNGKVKTTVAMELHIDSTASDSVWKWEIHYVIDSNKPDIRKYLLKLKDNTKGNYVIDEENGIILDAKLFNNTLVSRFSVQNNLLLIKYRFEADSIFVEIFTGKENEKQKTGDIELGENKIPAVYNYSFTNYQKAVLRKSE